MSARAGARRLGLLGLGIGLGLAACGAPPARTVPLRVDGTPGDARVTIDDIYVGTLDMVRARGVALPPGAHRVTVEAPGHFPWDRLVEARPDGGPVRLSVRLEPVPD